MKKRWGGILAVALAAGLLSACGSGNASTGGANADKSGGSGAKKAEIKVAIVATGNVPVDFQKQIDRFNESGDGSVHAEIQTFSSGDAYNQALMGQIAGGVAPDVFVIDAGLQMRQFAESQAILPLDDLVAEAGIDKAAFESNLIEAATMDGKLYGVPKDYNTTALFYDKDAFEAAGLQAPATLDELRKAAKALTSGDRFGFGIMPQINYYYPFIQAAGADFITAAGIDKDAFLSKAHEDALNDLVSLFTADKSAASPQMVAAGWDGEMFANKKTAMLYGGSWIPGVILQQDQSLHIGAAPLPAGDAKSSMLYATGWVISSKSGNPAAAMQLIKFLTSDDELVSGNQSGLIGLPPTSSAMAELMETKKDDPFLAVYNEAVKNGKPFGWADATFVDDYNKMLERLIYKPGDTTVRQALEELAKKLPAAQ